MQVLKPPQKTGQRWPPTCFEQAEMAKTCAWTSEQAETPDTCAWMSELATKDETDTYTCASQHGKPH